MKDFTPPHKDFDENGLPSYFRGYLYYYDAESDNNMRWVLYDGSNKVRYASRTALENDIIQRQVKVPEAAVEQLMRAYARLQRAYQDIDEAANQIGDANIKVGLEVYAVNLRRYADDIDTVIAQLVDREGSAPRNSE